VTRSNIGIRRAAALLAGAAAATFALVGCGTGQVAETSNKVSSVLGTNAELSVDGGSYKVRNLHIAFSEEGYEAGATAPMEVALFNDTNEPVTVRVTSEAARSVTLLDASATPAPTTAAPTASPSGEASEEPSASPSAPEGSPDLTGSPQPDATPSALPPAGSPASITIPPNGYVLLTEKSGRELQLVGLTEELTAGTAVDVTFDFNGQQLQVPASVAPPLTPLPRPSSAIEGEDEEHA